MRLSIALLPCVLVMMAYAEARSTFHPFRWNVKEELDFHHKRIITINGETPGPSIQGQQGDTVEVKVTNSLMEKLAILWYGVRQIGSPRYLRPILPGQTFTYHFILDQLGTHSYYSHYSMQKAAGLYGGIRVLPPDGIAEPYAYDYEQSVILNDWYNKSTNDGAFYWDGEPASLQIQGKGKFDSFKSATPSSDTVAYNATIPAYLNWTVIPGKTYCLRISSVAIRYALSFQIEGHNLTVVEADGHYTEPFMAQNLFIYPGETYSVLVKADQDPLRSYWITSGNVGQDATSTTPPGLNLLNYQPNHPKRVPPTDPPTGPIRNDVALQLAQTVAIKARQGYVRPPPPKADRVIMLLITRSKIDGYFRWSMNYVSLTLPHMPCPITLKENLHHVFDQHSPPNQQPGFADYDMYGVANKTNATSSDSIYRLKVNTTVDIILQNASTRTANNSETLPWHLHGHDFWVLGYGTGKFNVTNDPKKYNLVNPIMKDTVVVHPYGWTALRFVANKPGV
ncbi:hypothetical protein BT93_I0301 [Corymbia citriodora subsp. variegata]|nr:hypothetical protein BT93_I0301 [Corymbia citriodora subsp. variegata]